MCNSSPRKDGIFANAVLKERKVNWLGCLILSSSTKFCITKLASLTWAMTFTSEIERKEGKMYLTNRRKRKNRASAVPLETYR